MEPEEYPRIAQLEESHWWYRGLRERVIAECDDRVGKDAPILDVGCGTGGTMMALRSRFPSARIVGVDVSPLAIFHAARKGARHLVYGNINDLPFADGTFDVIVALDILYHEAVDEKRALHELFRVLRSGGSVVVNAPAFDWLRSDHDAVIHTARRYTTARLRTKAVEAGFEVVKCEYRNSLLFPLMVMERFARKIFPSATPRSAVVRHSAPANFLLGAVLAFENTLTRCGIRFPAGGSVFAVLTRPLR